MMADLGHLLDRLGDPLAIWTALLVLGTLLLVGVTFHGVKQNLYTLTFTEYTRRYAEIVEIFPDAVRRPGETFDFASLSKEDRDRILRGMRRYLNLCSEEFYLHKSHKIDNDTWNIWKEGMRDTARFPCYRESWQYLRQEYAGYEKFQAFMDDIVTQPKQVSRRWRSW